MTKIIQNNIYLLFIFLQSFYSFSQNKITGQILDKENNPIQFVTIQLHTKDHILIKSDISNENGMFEIEEKTGHYVFQASYLGSLLYEKQIDLDKDINLGVITSNNGIELAEIVIESKLKMKTNFDKYEITNISNSILAKNKSTLEFLNTVPIVNVTPDGKAIKIKNSKNAIILINGKSVGGNEVALSILQSTPATDIKKVVVIEHPGSNYRASDNGIINVIINKSKKQPFKVVLNAKSTQSFYNTQEGSGYLAFSKNKWFLTSGIKMENAKLKSNQSDSYFDFITNYNTQIHNNSISKNTNYTPYINIDYSVNKNQTIGINLSSRFSNNENNRHISNSYYNLANNQLDSINTTNTKNKLSNYHVVFFNLNHTIITDTLDSNISSDVSYYNSRNNREIFNTFSYSNHNNNKLLQNPDNTYEVIDFKSDYDKNFKDRSKLTTGVSYTNSNIKSDNFFGTFNGIEYVSNPKQSNIFNYKENYFALYAKYRRMLSESFGVLAGLRYEYLSAEGTLKSNTKTVKINNSDLFPSLAIMYGINDEHLLTLNFASSITRTPYNNLNPFVYVNSPSSIQVNTPYLKNTKKSFIGLTYTFFDDFNLELGYAKSHNLFNNFDTIKDNLIISTIDNYGNNDAYGANFYFNKSIFKNYWNLSFSTTLEISNIRGEHNANPVKIDNANLTLNVKNNIFLDKEKNSTLTLIYGYDNGSEDIFGKLNAQHSLSIDLGKSFNDFYISAGAYDLLTTDTSMQFTNSVYGFDKKREYYKNYYINIRYTLGNKRVKTVASKQQNERLN